MKFCISLKDPFDMQNDFPDMEPEDILYACRLTPELYDWTDAESEDGWDGGTLVSIQEVEVVDAK